MTIDRPTPPPYAWAADYRACIGITGTNGKTSTTFLVAACMRAAGHGVVRIGTLGYHVDDARTDPPRWQEIDLPRNARGFYESLRLGHERGIRHAALEITSKALANNYAKRWRFDHAVFTNLSPDHLDTHGTWEHYLAAKAQLFVHLGPGQTAVLNASDEHALFIDRAMPADVRRTWFSSPTRGPALTTPDVLAAAIDVTLDGTRVALAAGPIAEALGGAIAVRLVGEVFAENAMAAAAVSLAAGIPADAVVAGLATCEPVPGRFQVVARDPAVVVDYAHTPDALARTCDAARKLVPAGGRLVVVMGAGGDRTKEKRGPMGEETGRRADVVIVTSDNPRSEDPRAIAAAVEAGARQGGRAAVRTILDRREAIEAAITFAHARDLVIVAGKGHETGQEIAGTTLPFSDVDEVRRITSA